MRDEVLDILKKSIKSDENTQSSHWKKYHSKFKYDNGILYGLEGFGTNSKPLKGVKKIIYNLLLKRYHKNIINKSLFQEIKKNAIEIAHKQNRLFDLDILRQCLTIDFLSHHKLLNESKTVVVIGDGWGIMTSLLLKLKIVERVILINLNKTLLVDLIYTSKVSPKIVDSCILLEEKSDISKIKNVKLVAIRADNYGLLRYVQKDLVINIASFQEMNIDVINNYIEYLENGDKSFFLYHCNREEKVFPDGSITKIKDYKFKSNKKIIVNEICPWHKDFIVKKPPFIIPYDGIIIHQLYKLNI